MEHTYNARCMGSNSLCKFGAERANRRDAHKKTLCAASLSILFLAFLPFPSSHISTSSSAMAKESGGALENSRSGQSPVAAFSEFWDERVSGEGNFSDNHIIHLFTIRLLTAQSAAPAGGRAVRPHHLAPPSRRH